MAVDDISALEPLLPKRRRETPLPLLQLGILCLGTRNVALAFQHRGRSNDAQ